jgi:hypothetical protein
MFTAAQVLQILARFDKIVQDEEGHALIGTDLFTSWDGNCHSAEEVLAKICEYHDITFPPEVA